MAANFARLARCGVFGLTAMLFAATSTVEGAPPAPRRTKIGSTGVKPGAKTPPSQPPTKPIFDAPTVPSNDKKPPVPPLPPKLLPEDDVDKSDSPEPKTSAPTDLDIVPMTKGAPVEPRTASETPYPPDADGKYLLRYHFSTGETVRWKVVHHATIVTSVQGSTQAAETTSISIKSWRVEETLPGGEAKFLHQVDSIDMRQKLTGRQEVRYDSRTDKDAPPVFAAAAQQVGIPLAEVTLDSRGFVLKRADRMKRPEGASSNTMALNLPDKSLAIGESWSSPFDLSATDAEGQPKSIKARNKLTLDRIEGNTAVLRYETIILSPIDDPTVESQVVQYEQTGEVRFDLQRGRLVERTSQLDREVFGFQGDDSKMHYVTQFSEKLIENVEVEARKSDDTEAR